MAERLHVPKNEMIFYRISVFRDTIKNHFIFDLVQHFMPHFMIVLIPFINLSNLSWIIKCLFFEEYGAFKGI